MATLTVTAYGPYEGCEDVRADLSGRFKAQGVITVTAGRLPDGVGFVTARVENLTNQRANTGAAFADTQAANRGLARAPGGPPGATAEIT
jgi:hypothetical protein